MRDLLIGGILLMLVLSFLKGCADSAIEQQRLEDAARLEMIRDMSEFHNEINKVWNNI